MKNSFLIMLIVIGILAAVLFFLFGRGSALAPSDNMSTPTETPAPPLQGTSNDQISDSQPAVVMTMRDNDYEPSHMTIQRGQTIKFSNASSRDRWPASNIHPTHEIYPEFDPKRPISPGESWSFQFDRAGEWRCHDHLMPSISCVITVQ